jgi:hypothetical protein
MRSYRLYLLDSCGHIYSARDIACEDDQAARNEAEKASTKSDVEVWERSRLVAKIASAGESHAA